MFGIQELLAYHESFGLKKVEILFQHKMNINYLSYGALSRDVFTEKLSLLQEFLKSHAAVRCGGLKSPDRCIGPL